MYLNTHTYYSLRYGTMSPEALAQQAALLKIDTLVLTDINNCSAVFDFVKACVANGITPLVGMEFSENSQLLYICIAKNNDGFREINDFRTHHNMQGTALPLIAPFFNNVFVVYPFDISLQIRQLADNEYVGIRPEQLNRLISSPWQNSKHKLVVLQPVSYLNANDYELHCHLRAIDKNKLLTHLLPSDRANPHEGLLSPMVLKKSFERFPFIIDNTINLIKMCSFSVDFKTVKNKKTYTGSHYDDKLLLQKLALDGMVYRYGLNCIEAKQRIEKELHIIDKLGFAAYFLITADMVRYSMSRGFYHVGRGSGANSIVAYCLKITDVDPIELNLYFERFLNPKRTSPPDFDIDYSWKERDHVQDYLFKRYGAKHTALLGATGTFQGKSTLRELGKVYGLPKEEIDNLENCIGQSVTDPIVKNILRIGSIMTDVPNIRTIHAGGIIISEEPITAYTSLDLPPKGFATTQWDMYVAEMIGFEKLDVLSQRGIGHIKEGADWVLKNRGVKLDMHQVEKFKTDTKVLEMLAKGETNGCFYIESPAMRGLLRKLNCNNYITLVAASSIIRPGVARSGMMKQYIERFHKPKGFNYLHPVMKEQLEETYGVMVYQEDVIKVCHHFAGLDLADADVLRRAMSGKFRSKAEFQRIVDKFFENCRQKGYPEPLIQEVWRQIESFAGYSFSKAHSASYAVESFQSLYLKTYYPLEFMVAVINNFGGFYPTWVYVNEAKRWGATIHLPCINNGNYLTSIVGNDIYLGFVHIQNLEQAVAHNIVAERQSNGLYKGLADFVARTVLGREQMILLIRIGALRFTGQNKPQLMWQVQLLLNQTAVVATSKLLFAPPTQNYCLPTLSQLPIEDAYDELELLGFPVTLSHFELLETSFRGALRANELINHVGKRVRMVGLLVTIKYVRTVRNQTMHFGCFIDGEGEIFDTVHFPPSLKAFPFKGPGVYLILGRIVNDFGQPSIEVEKLAKLPVLSDPRGQ